MRTSLASLWPGPMLLVLTPAARGRAGYENSRRSWPAACRGPGLPERVARRAISQAREKNRTDAPGCPPRRSARRQPRPGIPAKRNHSLGRRRLHSRRNGPLLSPGRRGDQRRKMRGWSINTPPGHPPARKCRIVPTVTGTTATTALCPRSRLGTSSRRADREGPPGSSVAVPARS